MMGMDYAEKNRIGNLEMPFGKHVGKRIDQIDLAYLDWLNGEAWFNDKFAELAESIDAYLHDPVIARELEAQLEERD